MNVLLLAGYLTVRLQEQKHKLSNLKSLGARLDDTMQTLAARKAELIRVEAQLDELQDSRDKLAVDVASLEEQLRRLKPTIVVESACGFCGCCVVRGSWLSSDFDC